MSGLAQWFMLGPFFYQGRLVTSPRLYHYAPGTTQEKTAWSDRNQTITAPNPIVGDANGLVAGYFSGLYKIEVRTSDDAVILAQYDNVQIVDPVDSLEPVELRPEDYGGGPSSSGDNTDPILEAFSEFGAAGGVLRLAPGDYKFSGTLNRGDKRTIIQGAGIDVTFLTMTAQSSGLHGITGTNSLWLRDLTLRVQNPLTTNYQMYGVRMNLDGSGITGGRFINLEHVKMTGWNASVYCDGGEDYGIENAFYQDIWLQSSGPASDYIGSACYMNRVRNGYVGRGIIDQGDTGEHAIYCFGARNLTVEQMVIENASRGESQAIKLVGDGVTPTGVFGNWAVRDVDFKDCFHGIMIQAFGTERLGTVEISNIKGKNITGSTNVLGGLVTTVVGGTASIDTVIINGASGEDLGAQAIAFSGGGSGKVRLAIVRGVRVANWGTLSSGVYTLIGAAASSQVVDTLRMEDIEADGGGTGRTIWTVNGFGGYGTERIGRLIYSGLKEKNTTSAEEIPTINQADATPSLRFGRVYKMSNGSAQNITAFDDIEPGKEYTFLVDDGNTTLVDGASLMLSGSANWNPQDTDVWNGLAFSSTVMRESGRSDNS